MIVAPEVLESDRVRVTKDSCGTGEDDGEGEGDIPSGGAVYRVMKSDYSSEGRCGVGGVGNSG